MTPLCAYLLGCGTVLALDALVLWLFCTINRYDRDIADAQRDPAHDETETK